MAQVVMATLLLTLLQSATALATMLMTKQAVKTLQTVEAHGGWTAAASHADHQLLFASAAHQTH